MPITKADVEKIAELARLELSPEETEAFTGQLGAILDYIEKLNQLHTENVLPMSHCPTEDDPALSLREDAVKPSLGSRDAVENAPDPENGFFRVPKVIGG